MSAREITVVMNERRIRWAWYVAVTRAMKYILTVKFWSVNAKEREHLKNLGLNEFVMLKLSSQK